MPRLENRVAIVTGGARGMGAVTAKLLAENGAEVVIADILDETGEATAAAIGEHAHYRHVDVSSASDWKDCVAFANTLGPLRILVNNAAMLYAASISDTPVEDYMRVISINQAGVFLGMQSVLEPMKAAGGGSIINISSIDGLQSKNGLIAYSSSKWAVRGMTKCAAIEFGPHNIRVNSVHPGGIFTAMANSSGDADASGEPSDADNAFYTQHALPRIGMPEEVARMTVFLAGDEASYSTGSEFIVDGGWNAGLRVDVLPGA